MPSTSNANFIPTACFLIKNITSRSPGFICFRHSRTACLNFLFRALRFTADFSILEPMTKANRELFLLFFLKIALKTGVLKFAPFFITNSKSFFRRSLCLKFSKNTKYYAESLRRPFLRLRTNVLLPLALLERFKNPCLRDLLIFLGFVMRIYQRYVQYLLITCELIKITCLFLFLSTVFSVT